MSNSVTNVEIEDVLSSIRRLVSADTRPKAQENASGEGKLVLTAADRITDAQDAAQPSDEQTGETPPENHAEAPAENTPAEDGPEQATIESRIAELEEAVDGQADEWEPDGSEEMPADDDVASKVPSFMHRSIDDVTNIEDAYVYDGASETDDAGVEAAGAVASEAQVTDLESAKAEAADLEPTETNSAEEQDAPEHDQPEAPAHDDVGAIAAENTQAAVRETHHDAHMAETQAPQDEAVPQYDAQPEEPQSAVDEIQPEPRLTSAAPEQDTPEPQQDSAAEPAATILGSQEAEAALEAALSDEGDDEDYLDEEAIRDMVREIVREELQGVLGERITRNVRKLVRREIHRAMTSSELE